MKNEELLLDVQAKCFNIANEMLNAVIDAEWTFYYKWPKVATLVTKLSAEAFPDKIWGLLSDLLCFELSHKCGLPVQTIPIHMFSGDTFYWAHDHQMGLPIYMRQSRQLWHELRWFCHIMLKEAGKSSLHFKQLFNLCPKTSLFSSIYYTLSMRCSRKLPWNFFLISRWYFLYQ